LKHPPNARKPRSWRRDGRNRKGTASAARGEGFAAGRGEPPGSDSIDRAEKQVDRFVSEVEDSLAASDWVRARSAIIAGKRDFPDQVVFDDLATQAQSKQREAETKKALAAVREI